MNSTWPSRRGSILKDPQGSGRKGQCGDEGEENNESSKNDFNNKCYANTLWLFIRSLHICFYINLILVILSHFLFLIFSLFICQRGRGHTSSRSSRGSRELVPSHPEEEQAIVSIPMLPMSKWRCGTGTPNHTTTNYRRTEIQLVWLQGP